MVPSSRVYTDPLHLLAYGSDASFYRLLPKAVIKVHTEAEVVQLLRLAQRHHVPVTFRAAGTSLSGQAITDSILIKVGCGWQQWDAVHDWCVQQLLLQGSVQLVMLLTTQCLHLFRLLRPDRPGSLQHAAAAH